MLLIILPLLKTLPLLEKGFIYSIGKKKFLSLDLDHIRILPRHQMPEPFEIEKRGGSDGYKLRIMPVPRQDNQVIDKDWWTNDHRLILHKPTEWESEKFIFALLPKNKIKIVVKDNCILAEDSGYVRATDCQDVDDQLFRWIPVKNEMIVEQFVERHGGKPIRRGKWKKLEPHDNEDDDDFITPDRIRPNRKKWHDTDSDFVSVRRTRPSGSGRHDDDCDSQPPRLSLLDRHDEDSDYLYPHRRKHHHYRDEDYEYSSPRNEHVHGYSKYNQYVNDDNILFKYKSRYRDDLHNIPQPSYNDVDDIYYKYRKPYREDRNREDRYKDNGYKDNRYKDDRYKDNGYKDNGYKDDGYKVLNHNEHDNCVFCDPTQKGVHAKDKKISTKESLNCDEIVDSIEKVIRDIDGLPNFL